MEKEVLRDLERIFQQYFNIAGTLSSLSITKQKMIERGLQEFEKESLSSELNSLAAKVQDLAKNIKHLSASISDT